MINHHTYVVYCFYENNKYNNSNDYIVARNQEKIMTLK